MLVKEDSRDGLDNLCGRIAVGTRIVYHRKVRFGKREDDAVEFRNLPKRLAHLPADIVQIRLAKKVVFAIFVKKPSNILVHCLRHEALAMPEVDALARPVRDIHGLAQLAAIRLDGRNIYCRRRLRVWFVGKKTVEPAMRLVALATNLERINTTIFRRLFDDAPHVLRLHDDRVHHRPSDFRSSTRDIHRGGETYGKSCHRPSRLKQYSSTSGFGTELCCEPCSQAQLFGQVRVL